MDEKLLSLVSIIFLFLIAASAILAFALLWQSEDIKSQQTRWVVGLSGSILLMVMAVMFLMFSQSWKTPKKMLPWEIAIVVTLMSCAAAGVIVFSYLISDENNSTVEDHWISLLMASVISFIMLDYYTVFKLTWKKKLADFIAYVPIPASDDNSPN